MFGLLAIWVFSGPAVPAGADPFDPQLGATGSLTFDTEVAGLRVAPATQGGTIEDVLSTLPSSSAYADSTPPSVNPLGGTLTDFGDGFGVEMHGSDATDAGEIFTGSDFVFELTNDSVSEFLQVTLRVDFQNQVAVSSGDGAYASSEFFIEDAQGVERFATAVAAYGGDGGGIASEAGPTLVDIVIPPGGAETLHGDWTADALSADAAETASIAFDTFVSIQAVPEPGPAGLWPCLALLAALGRGAPTRTTRRPS